MFLVYFLAVRSRKCLEKFSWCQVCCFLGFVLSSFGFFVDAVFRCFFLRDKDQVVTGHPFTRTCFAGSFSFCVPPLLSVSPVLAVRPASWWFSRGAILGPARFWDSPGTYGAWARSPLPRPFSGDARRQGFSCASLALFSFSPCVLFCGHTFSRSPSRWSRRSGPWGSPQPLARVRARGSASSAEGWSPPCSVLFCF